MDNASPLFKMEDKKQSNQILRIGNPVKPMLVSESGFDKDRYEKIMKNHNGVTFAEVKSDGYRVQTHKDFNGDVKLYTRNLNELNSDVFPDIFRQLNKLPSGIYDGELVGVEDGIKGFNAVKKRVRKDLDKKLVEAYSLNMKFFDILLEGEDEMIDVPLYERRKKLESLTDDVSYQSIITYSDVLKNEFESVIENGLEGLVCKNPEAGYLIGGRTKDWMKLKKFLTLDLVILGLYKGQGKLAELPFAGVLLGAKNNKNYETITKVGLTNPKKVNSIYEQIRCSCVNKVPENVIISDAINKKTYARKIPFCYINPENSVVLETQTMNVTNSNNWHSCGLKDGKAYSLRIPIVREIRTDKKVEDCTTISQIKDLYEG